MRCSPNWVLAVMPDVKLRVGLDGVGASSVRGIYLSSGGFSLNALPTSSKILLYALMGAS